MGDTSWWHRATHGWSYYVHGFVGVALGLHLARGTHSDSLASRLVRSCTTCSFASQAPDALGARCSAQTQTPAHPHRGFAVGSRQSSGVPAPRLTASRDATRCPAWSSRHSIGNGDEGLSQRVSSMPTSSTWWDILLLLSCFTWKTTQKVPKFTIDRCLSTIHGYALCARPTTSSQAGDCRLRRMTVLARLDMCSPQGSPTVKTISIAEEST